MASDRLSARPQPEIIDLVSDDSDMDLGRRSPASPPLDPAAYEPVDYGQPVDLDSDDEFFDFAAGQALFNAPADPPPPPTMPAAAEPERRGTILKIDGVDVFIPDEEEPPHAPGALQAGVFRDHEIALALDGQTYTADQCLQRVLEIFADISHDHVRKLYNDFDTKQGYENMLGSARFDNIIEQLLSASSYPKQEKGKEALKKRKREDSITETDNDRWERDGRETVPRQFQGCMRAMLKADFPEIPQQYIQSTLATNVHLYQAYVALANARNSYNPAKPAYGKGRGSKTTLANAATIAMSSGFPALVDELQAAQSRAAVIKCQLAAELARKRAEQANLDQAKARGETAECSACFDDLPMNRMIHCDGTTAHFTCYECADTYIKSEVGDSRCNVVCPAGCGFGFAYRQLQLLSDKQLLAKLAELEQEKAIRDAGLDDLEECPFCDYKVILPPVEEDFEFRCANPECEKVSCRRCKAISHIPLSCEQYAKDNKINSRHKIEEAMTAALIRHCTKCKKQFIKDFGCNKMTCPSCGNLQCYVCSATLKDYNHFDQGSTGRRVNGQVVSKCPLYDNVEERHEREVKEAEAAARAQVIEEHPDVDAKDLEIQVSDAVKKATTDRIQRGGANGMGGGFGGGFYGGVMPALPAARLPDHPLGFFLGGGDGAQDMLDRAGDIDRRLALLNDDLALLRGPRVDRARVRRARPRRLDPVDPPGDAAPFRPYVPPRAAPGAPPRPYPVPFGFIPAAPVPAPVPAVQHNPNFDVGFGALPAPQPIQDYDPFNYLRPFGNPGPAADLQAQANLLNNLERQHAQNRAAGRGPAPLMARHDRDFRAYHPNRAVLPGDVFPAAVAPPQQQPQQQPQQSQDQEFERQIRNVRARQQQQQMMVMQMMQQQREQRQEHVDREFLEPWDRAVQPAPWEEDYL